MKQEDMDKINKYMRERPQGPWRLLCEDDAKGLPGEGYKQTSRKYRHVARLPPGETGIEALKRVAPEEYERIVERLERESADWYRRIYATRDGNTIELTLEQFEAFRAAGGEAS